MTKQLPDIAAIGIPEDPMPLEWVGMNGIDLPVVIEEADYCREHHARVDAQVNLPLPQVRGIHMSRLHRIIDNLGDGAALTPGRLGPMLADMVASHADCGSDRARLQLNFNLLVRRGALESSDIGGWRSYPVTLDALADGAGTTLGASVRAAYSSTCPCSAALSRQLIEREFVRTFGEQNTISATDAATWLRKHATLATPHGQRSDAWVRVGIEENAASFGLLDLIDRVENALATPVQTAVKRVDEQAFAARNGQNLMFVEDAARKIRKALADDYADIDVQVAHMESLHPHDAVASAGR